MGEDVKESGSARTGSAKWTVDLFGRTLAMPKRRQIASIACWLFAGVSLVTIVMGGVSYFDDWLFLEKIFVPLTIVGEIFGTIACVFALVYALQLARWLGSRPLAWASALIFGALFIGDATDTGLRALWLHLYPSTTRWYIYTYYGIQAWGTMTDCCLIALLAVLAVRLGRAARRG